MSEESQEAAAVETEAPQETAEQAAPTAPLEGASEGSESDLPEWARKKLDKVNREAQNLRARLKDAEPLVQAAQAAEEAQRTDLERAQDAIKVHAERETKFRDRAVTAEAKVLAREFANPDVAVRLLGDLTSYVDESGDIDTDKITADLSGLLEREPYLGRTQEPREMKPNRAQGQSGGAPLTPGQMAQDKEQQGDWRAASAIKADQLLDLAKKIH